MHIEWLDREFDTNNGSPQAKIEYRLLFPDLKHLNWSRTFKPELDYWADSRKCTAIYCADHLIFLVIVVKLQMYAKYFRKDRKITQSWKRLENFYVYFYVIFACCCQ